MQIKNSFIKTIPFILSAISCQVQAAPEQISSADNENWKLVWSDEFNDQGLPDPEKWSYDVGGHGWGNDELQHYTEYREENARVEGGKLVIEAHREAFQDSGYTSARLVTRGKEAWKYGRLEISAKLPSGLGTWPAIWMLPVDWDFGSGAWPGVGEIDIMEHVGYDSGIVHATMHSQKYNWKVGTQKSAKIEVPTATEAFHQYSLEWEEDEIRAYVDGEHYFTYSKEESNWESWPYNRDFYLILNVAVGGSWGGAEGVDPGCFPQQMLVDYVRVYKRVNDGG